MKKIRIAAGAGFAGDRIEPALDIIRRGKADYIIFECLAERTLALAQRQKAACPDQGYNPLLEYRFRRIIPLLREHPIQIITNMGAANPVAAARKISRIAEESGIAGLKIAAVTGDDVLDRLDRYGDTIFMETGQALSACKERILSANVYIGAQAITQALEEGADIVVTGRAADASLTVGPLMQAFGRSYDDYTFIGQATAAGHLLECCGQVTGGYYADPGYKDVPALWDLGFPIVTFYENGDFSVEKLPGTGGLLCVGTVAEQLLYELEDPARYLTPDGVADFSHIRLREEEDKVWVSGAAGREKTGTLKVSVGYTGGFVGEGEISYGGPNCLARAALAREVLERRFAMLDLGLEELRFDYIGVNSLYGGERGLCDAEPREVRLRAAARAADRQTAEAVGREVESLYVNGPAGGGGVRCSVTDVISIASILIPEEDVLQKLIWIGGETG